MKYSSALTLLLAAAPIVIPRSSKIMLVSHHVENTSKTEKLVWIELYKADRIADISLTQWLPLTPPEIVAATMNISLSVVQNLKTEKQLIIAQIQYLVDLME
ncbi:hypothetical protein OIDMADRAFT_183739 [Oidiodendron maius Zn]|uniref:Uncharacterized protein n=1 Tax=Oidiodendron maius (strain Zn) TaxID=913774 RepID=A0A0C3GWZ2_OIDMZ|nr:hypothetical protein OIDMADRAFT_183739 [Oidiodendron maius Zn]